MYPFKQNISLQTEFFFSYRILSHNTIYVTSHLVVSCFILTKNIPGSYIIKHQIFWFQYLKALRTFTPRKLPLKPPRNPVGSTVVSPAEISIFCTQGSVMKVESSVDCPAVKALGIFHKPPQSTSKIIQISHLKKDRWVATSNSHSVLEIANRTGELHHLLYSLHFSRMWVESPRVLSKEGPQLLRRQMSWRVTLRVPRVSPPVTVSMESPWSSSANLRKSCCHADSKRHSNFASC